MFAYFPAPELCQGADEGLIIEMGAIIFPGFVERNPGGNGLRLKLEGDYKDDSLLEFASNQFQILLGILRAWRPIAGQRKDEIWPGIGQGSIRDDQGNQVIKVGPAIAYLTSRTKAEIYAQEANIAIEQSLHLRNALWLNGRRDRNAADFFMMYEYAEMDLQGSKGIAAKLGFTHNDINRLRNSANNLAPTEGGRHAHGSGETEWNLADQMKFISGFLRSWIEYRSRKVV